MNYCNSAAVSADPREAMKWCAHVLSCLRVPTPSRIRFLACFSPLKVNTSRGQRTP